MHTAGLACWRDRAQRSTCIATLPACSEEIDLAELQRIMLPLQPSPAKQEPTQQAQQAQQQQAQQAQQAVPAPGSPQQSALASHHTQLDGRPGAAEDTAATAAAAAPPSTIRQRRTRRLSADTEPAAAGTAGRTDAEVQAQLATGEPAPKQVAGAAAAAAAAGEPAAGTGSQLGRRASAGKPRRQAQVVDSESEEEDRENGRCG